MNIKLDDVKDNVTDLIYNRMNSRPCWDLILYPGYAIPCLSSNQITENCPFNLFYKLNNFIN